MVQKIRDTWTNNGKQLDQAYAALQELSKKLDFNKFDPRLKTILGEVEGAKPN